MRTLACLLLLAGCKNSDYHDSHHGLDASNGFLDGGAGVTDEAIDAAVDASRPDADVPPTVVSVSPVDGATDVPVAATITVTFDKPVTVADGAILVAAGPNSVAGTVSVAGAVATFQPTLPLPAGATLSVDVTTQVTDLAGTPLALASTTSFTTIAAAQVVSSLPVAGRVGIGTGSTTIDLAFSRALDPATLTIQAADGACSGTLQISGDAFSTCVGGTIVTSDDLTFAVTADAPWATDTTYGVSTTGAATPDGVSVVPDTRSFMSTRGSDDALVFFGGAVTNGGLGGIAGADAIAPRTRLPAATAPRPSSARRPATPAPWRTAARARRSSTGSSSRTSST